MVNSKSSHALCYIQGNPHGKGDQNFGQSDASHITALGASTAANSKQNKEDCIY